MVAASLLSAALVSSLALSELALVPRRAALPPCQRRDTYYRSRPPHLGASGGGEQVGSVYGGFVMELRRAKAALLLALRTEQPQGPLDEDAQAMVDALAEVNPSAPDPTADTELWRGDFELLSAPLGGLFGAPGVVQAAGSGVRLSETSASVRLELEIGGDCAGECAQVELEGAVVVAGEEALMWELSSVVVRAQAPKKWEAPLQAALRTLDLEGARGVWSDGAWSASAPAHGGEEGGSDEWPVLRTEIRYLDQDLMILSLGDAAQLPPLVLSRPPA